MFSIQLFLKEGNSFLKFFSKNIIASKKGI